MKQHIGICILNYNCENETSICLNSIKAAKTEVSFCVVLVENGSAENSKKAVKQQFEEFCLARQQKGDILIDLEKNLGFSGGNNKGIKHLLEQPDITHIMLLNADTVVSNYWLENLLKQNALITGPVSNSGAGIQTIFCDRELQKDKSSIGIVQEIADQRYKLFKDVSVLCEFVSFFAMLIERSVFDMVGLLDERFFPGYFEDDDYCMRAAEKSIEMVVARDCYMHHFGESSFGKVVEKNDIVLENLERFQAKWGVVHKGREHLIYQSALMDFETACKGKVDSAIFAQVTKALEYAKGDRAFLVEHFAGQISKQKIGDYQEIPFSEMKKQIVHKIKRKFKR